MIKYITLLVILRTGVPDLEGTMDVNETTMMIFTSMQELLRTAESRQIVDMSKGEFFALSFISKRGTMVLPSEISTAMNVSTARIAVLLSQLESRGLIARAADTADRRRVNVSITPAGVQRLEERRKEIFQRILRLVEQLGEEDAQAYLRITKRIVALSENINK